MVRSSEIEDKIAESHEVMGSFARKDNHHHQHHRPGLSRQGTLKRSMSRAQSMGRTGSGMFSKQNSTASSGGDPFETEIVAVPLRKRKPRGRTTTIAGMTRQKSVDFS